MNLDSMSKSELIGILSNFFVKAQRDFEGKNIKRGEYYRYAPISYYDEEMYILFPFQYKRFFDFDRDTAIITKEELLAWGGTVYYYYDQHEKFCTSKI